MTTTEITPAERIAQRIATARALSESVQCRNGFDALEEANLIRVARRVYAHAVVRLGVDPDLVADGAEEATNDELNDHTGEPIQPEDAEDTKASAEHLDQARRFMTHAENLTIQDRDQAYTLCVDILASLMHAAHAAHGNLYAIYDAAEPFADISDH